MVSKILVLLLLLVRRSWGLGARENYARTGSRAPRLPLQQHDEPLPFDKFDVKLKASPLIGGPSWLPVHVKVVLQVDGIRDLVWDFVPLNATERETVQQLVQLKAVPGRIRLPDVSFSSTRDANVLEILAEAEKYCDSYGNTDLHLLWNNCWTFAVPLYFHLLLARIRR